MDDRIVILGENGIGKTTLMKLMINKLKPNNGNIKINPRCDLEFIINILLIHYSDMSPVEYLINKSKKYDEINYQESRNLLGKFGLKGNSQILKISDLSGGQKARVVFTSLFIENPNFIFLDEPTNNLDIQSVNA